MNVARDLLTAEDARTLAKRRLPPALYDSIESGSQEELTLRSNLEALREIELRPRAAIQHRSYNLGTTVLGHAISMPVMLAPTGNVRMYHTSGECAVARAAGAAGTIQIVSCFTGTAIEEVCAAAAGPVFFDLYVVGGRDNVELMLSRAKAAGCEALVITVDCAAAHSKERNAKARVFKPVGVNLETMLRFGPQMLTRPAWAADFLRDGMPLTCPMWIKPNGRAASFGEMAEQLFIEYPTWEHLPWIREHWDGPIVMKGILRADDARRAVDEGVDGIVVSNHGGRNVDGSPATVRVLPEIVDAVADELEVYVDSGFRRGTDVVKALALGARAVLLGRAYVYAHAAAGEAGVRQILEQVRGGIDATMRSLGCADVRALERSYVSLPATWTRAEVARGDLAE